VAGVAVFSEGFRNGKRGGRLPGSKNRGPTLEQLKEKIAQLKAENEILKEALRAEIGGHRGRKK